MKRTLAVLVMVLASMSAMAQTPSLCSDKEVKERLWGYILQKMTDGNIYSKELRKGLPKRFAEEDSLFETQNDALIWVVKNAHLTVSMVTTLGMKGNQFVCSADVKGAYEVPEEGVGVPNGSPKKGTPVRVNGTVQYSVIKTDDGQLRMHLLGSYP